MGILETDTLPTTVGALDHPRPRDLSLDRWRSVARDWRWTLVPFSIAVLSRLYSSFLLVQIAHRTTPLLTSDRSPFVAWDGQWYVRIAQWGYHPYPLQYYSAVAHHDFAFYPGWPLLIRAASFGGLLPYDGTAIVLANVLFIAAAIVLFRFFEDRFDGRVALWGTWLLCFNPAAYVLSMAYSEPLFLLTAGLYFVNRYGRASPAFAFLATLSRVSGLAIGASALVTFLRGGVPRPRLILIGGAVALGFAAWWIYIWRLTGNPFGWFEGSPSWVKYAGFSSIERELHFDRLDEIARLAFIALMVLGSLLLVRRHLDLAVYSLTAIGLSLAGAPASSMPRHAMVAFPVFAVLASRLGKRGSIVVLIVFAIGQILLIRMSFGPDAQPP
jgi:hypothetical protein